MTESHGLLGHVEHSCLSPATPVMGQKTQQVCSYTGYSQVDDVHAVREGTVRGRKDDIIRVAAVAAEDAIGACTQHDLTPCRIAVTQLSPDKGHGVV